MSTEAMRHVHQNFPKGGAHYVAMMSLAYLSKNRFDPYTAETTYRDLADECRVSKRQIFKTCERLLKDGYLAIKSKRGNGGKTVFTLRVLHERKIPENVVDFERHKGTLKYVQNGNTKGVQDDTFGQ